MMDFWTFLGVFWAQAGPILAICLIPIIIAAGIIGVIIGSAELHFRGHWKWNFLYVPSVLIVTFFAVSLVAWYVVGVYA